jgi:hypothetical protein
MQSDISLIEKVQERALRSVTGLKGTLYSYKCKEAGHQTLESRIGDQDPERN